MRTFDSTISNLIASEQAKGPWTALDIQVSTDTTYHFCNSDVDFFYDSKHYIARGFEITEIQQSANFNNDIASIEIDNADLEMSAIVLNDDMANKRVTADIVFETTAGMVGTELFNGVITKWTLNEQKATIGLGSEFMLWHKKTLRLPTPNCPWGFKSDECGYTGSSTSCDKTPEWCVELSNSSRFGGRKFIASIENKKIYWSAK